MGTHTYEIGDTGVVVRVMLACSYEVTKSDKSDIFRLGQGTKKSPRQLLERERNASTAVPPPCICGKRSAMLHVQVAFGGHVRRFQNVRWIQS